MSEGAFVWRYLDASGAAAGGSDGFDTRGDAEAWIGEAWGDLLDEGVEEVELVRIGPGDEEPLYRMSLRPASG